MATTQAVTGTVAVIKKPPVNKGGRPTKAMVAERERLKLDSVSQIEGDTSLDKPPEYRPDVSARVPKPPYFRYGTDQPSPRRPEHFFQWWQGLTPAARDKTLAYVYRNYPVIQIKIPSKKNASGFDITRQIDKRSGNDPLTSMDDILHYYGSGDYTIHFNQVDPHKTVCMCIIRGLRDDQHPPVVDPNTLAIEDPANKPYIEGLRMKGIRIPGVDPMEESDMAAAATMDRMVGTIERLTERNAQLASKPPSAPPRPEREPVNESIVSQALATGMGIIATASDTQNKMLEKTMEKIGQLKGDVGQQTDPLAMLDKVASVLKALTPTPVVQQQQSGPSQSDTLLQSAMARADKLETRIFEMQASQLTLLQGMLAKSQETPAVVQAKAAVPAGTPTTPLEMLKELVKLKDGLGSLTGEGERTDNPAPAAGSPWWASLLQNLPTLGQMALGIMAMYSQASYNNAIAATASATQAGANPSATLPIAPTMPVIPATEPAPGNNIPTPPTDTTIPLPHPGDSTMAAYHSFLAQLEKPLRMSLDSNETGDTFAEKLVEFHGQMSYDVLHNLGRDQLLQILSTYPPIWQVVSAMPQKFSQFLDEFMHYGDEPEVPALPAKPDKVRVEKLDGVTERMDRLHTVRVGGKPAAGGGKSAGTKVDPGPTAA